MLNHHVGMTVASLGAMAMLMQAVAPALPEATYLDKISQLGVTGLLAVAVVVLWRKLQDKDALLMANYKSMADSLAADKATKEKMAETLEAIKEAVERMETVRHTLKD
jgi:transcriptional regulator with GAF, ATPase, and Fis domain